MVPIVHREAASIFNTSGTKLASYAVNSVSYSKILTSFSIF